VVAVASLVNDARVRGKEDNEDGARSDDNIEANVDRLSAEATAALLEFSTAGNVRCSAYDPKEHIPPNALFLLSSASLRLHSRVFLRRASILAELDSLSSFSASSNVSARIPHGLRMFEAVLSEVLSIQ
jgi:hypothetical protein